MDFAQTVTIKYILGSGEEKTINFGFLSQNSFFMDRLQSAVSIVRNRHCCAGQLPTSNPPIVDIATPPTNVAKAGSGDNEAKLADEMEDQLDPRDAEEYIPTLRQIERFRFEFGLFGEEEDIYFATVGSLARTVPVFGKVALSKKGVMFSRKTAMTNRVKVCYLSTSVARTLTILVRYSCRLIFSKGPKRAPPF